MLVLNECFSDTYEFTLTSVNYSTLPPAQNPSETKISVTDETELIKLDNNKLKLSIKRSVTFNPNHLFDLNVCSSAILTGKTDLSLMNDDELKEVLLNNNPIIVNLTSRISLLISQIFSTFGREPFITPPYLIKQDNE